MHTSLPINSLCVFSLHFFPEGCIYSANWVEILATRILTDFLKELYSLQKIEFWTKFEHGFFFLRHLSCYHKMQFFSSFGNFLHRIADPVEKQIGLGQLTTEFPRWCSGKESTSQSRRCRSRRFDPGLGRSPRGGNGNPLQYSCQEKSHGQRSLVGHKKSAMTDWMSTSMHTC